MGPFGLITSKFGSMPKAVQVITYLIFVCLVVYLYLSPRVITGQIVATTENGGFVPYRGIKIQTHVQGHLLKFRTNEFGYWTIPVVNRLPDDVTIQVFHEDDKSWVPVTLKGWDVWTKNFRIEILPDKPLFKLQLAQASAHDADRPTQGRGLIISTAHAGALIDKSTYDRRLRRARPVAPTTSTPRRRPPIATSTTRSSRSMTGRTRTLAGIRSPALNNISAKVSQTTARVLGRNPATIPLAFRLDRRNGVSYVQRIQVIQDLEKLFAVKIPDEHWRRLVTIDEIARYIFERQQLAKSFPQIKKYQKQNDWPRIQQSIPTDKKPVFINPR